MKIKPVKRQSLVDSVAECIRATITEGQLRPGDRLPTETELIEQLQVSRTVVREAIRRLDTLGVVAVRGSRGMFVGDPGSLMNCVKLVRSAMAMSPRELIRFTEFRRAIECDAVRSAAERATPADQAELKALCEELRRDNLDKVETCYLDYRFHRKLLELSGNEMMKNIMDVVQEFVMGSIVQGGDSVCRVVETYRGHLSILKAVRGRDPDAAEAAMRAHIDAVIHYLQEIETGQQKERQIPSAG